jgi:hypothetical protein
MNILLMSLAFLCGVPIGIIIGIVVFWRMNVPDRGDDELDYSDGY